jgi:hypothetical protein
LASDLDLDLAMYRLDDPGMLHLGGDNMAEQPNTHHQQVEEQPL